MWLMVLPAGRQQAPVIRAAQQRGLRVLALDRDSAAAGFECADAHAAVDPQDIAAALDIARRFEVAAVFSPACDPCAVPAALVANALRLPGPPVDAVRRCTDKALARERLKEVLPQYCPAFSVIRRIEDLPAVYGRLGLPMVLKPTDNSGSRGVIVITEEAGLDPGYRHALRYSRHGTVIAEEFVRGRQCTVESITFRGQTHVVALCDTIVTAPPYCVSLGHAAPSALPSQVQDAVTTAAQQIIEAFGLTEAASHVEMIVTSDGPKLLEIGPRLSGGAIATHLAPLSTGIDVVGAALAVALGEPPEIRPGQGNAAAVRFVTAAEGLVERVSGLDEARQAAGVIEVLCTAVPGMIVSALQDSTSRLGHVVATAAAVQEAATRAEAARDAVKISVSAVERIRCC